MSSSPQRSYVIRNGMIIDGTRSAPFLGDVTVTGDRIAAIGSASRQAGRATEIDAPGMIVAPGFIDVHTPYPGNSVLSSASPSCGAIRADPPRQLHCFNPSTTASPKASTRST
jgi:N-acyl-D-aspartate/D-glutamate deacylase